MRAIRCFVLSCVVFAAFMLSATIYGSVQGLIHDPGHHPVQGAQVALKSQTSDWNTTTTSDDSGEFHFDSVPLGEYTVIVAVPGFANQEEKISVLSGNVARLHFALNVAGTRETVEVMDIPASINPESSTTRGTVDREQIAQTPGADQTNSLAMITDFTPGAYIVHDQLHIRGGHQVTWLLDGVPVPNTNIASNVGPQFDPKDVDYLEVQRGGYSADYGDRTYGVFNVVTRSGFERNRQGEIVANYGSYHNTNDQVSFGDHSERFAWYGSLSGNRSDLGLETPTTQMLHDQAGGLSGFGSIIFNRDPSDQLRLTTSLRGDHYQVPNGPDQQAQGIRDVENERDDFVNFSWSHTASNGASLTVSPFYHFNRAHYSGGYVGQPDPNVIIPEDDRGSTYMGGVATLAVTRGKHNARAGTQIWGGRDNRFFNILKSDGSNPPVAQRDIIWGNVETVFFEDQYKLTPWLTLNGGVRLTHFASTASQSRSENSADPRIGTAVRIPGLGWVARAFYGRFYQPPPLLTVSGPVLDTAMAGGGISLLPLSGERDEQREFGLAVPLRGWTVDLSNFRTGARNFFDHDALFDNLFLPLTISHARIRGNEVTLTSPKIAGRGSVHGAYSNQLAQASCPITGGLVGECNRVAPFFLDHDQRNTLSTGFNMVLPFHAWTAFNVNYGSGFLNGGGTDIPTHLSPHTTYDFSLGRSFSENWDVRITALNLSNHRYLLDNSNTFGGTHYVDPREISVQLKYRFRF